MSDVIPAQITQLPGRDFTYDNNPSAFEAILGGVGAFMSSQAEMAKAAEQRRSTEMGQAFAAMISKGLVETGPAPTGRQGFQYGGSPFYYTQPGAERTAALGPEQAANIANKNADTYKTQQETGQVESNPEALFPQFIKAQTSSPGFMIASMNDPVKAGAATVRSAQAMLDEMQKVKTERGTGSGTSSGKKVEGAGNVSIQGKNSKGEVVTMSVKKSDKAKIKQLLDAGGKIV